LQYKINFIFIKKKNSFELNPINFISTHNLCSKDSSTGELCKLDIGILSNTIKPFGAASQKPSYFDQWCRES
jgi:hypothetical protein